jgi:hypothetical protein
MQDGHLSFTDEVPGQATGQAVDPAGLQLFHSAEDRKRLFDSYRLAFPVRALVLSSSSADSSVIATVGVGHRPAYLRCV